LLIRDSGAGPHGPRKPGKSQDPQEGIECRLGKLRPRENRRYRAGDGLIFGPESRGLSGRWIAAQEAADRLVRIPIRSEARSLNLANAAAIGLFEALRQIEMQLPAII
jgi:tRNA(Leu) C34 or U34 (ribose-2'-O)-methylase TrmL